MEIEPIASIDGLGGESASEAILIEYLHQMHASPAQIALAEAKAKEQETTEQRAEDGDPIALLRLAQEQNQSTPTLGHNLASAAPPISSEQPASPPADHSAAAHPPGAHEPGKGEIIDIYD